MLTIVDRGADLLAGGGSMGADQVEALNSQVEALNGEASRPVNEGPSVVTCPSSARLATS